MLHHIFSAGLLKRPAFFTAAFLCWASLLPAQSVQIYPPNWWAGMKHNQVQLLIYNQSDSNFSKQKLSINYPGVTITKINKLDNGKFICADVTVAKTAKPGNATFSFSGSGIPQQVAWPIKPRRTGMGKTYAQGITSKDMVYFLMPDRFANGDTSNDIGKGLLERNNGRQFSKGRHGGDIQGVQQHLDYIKDFGATAIWMTPVLLNDMPSESFHGYAFTDHYKIDPRFGGEKAYHNLIDAVHAKGLKIIQDAVYNHVGINHIFVKDKPVKDWLNNWPTYTNTSYKDQADFDPYASKQDKKVMQDGWFTKFMPDLNERNPYVANFLIQHALWTVEEFGIDGWRIDTYPYNDLPFMNRCNAALLEEYPTISIFAETWVVGVPNQSFFVKNKYQNISFKSNLPGVTDFNLLWGMLAGLNEKFGWSEGFSKLYTTLAQDFVYEDPSKNCLFLDNHDLDRIFAVIGKDSSKLKQGLTWLLTLRGIPTIYYGTELLMDKFKDPSDAEVRHDFPGGWPGDSINAFVASGRTPAQNSIFNYIRILANYRKNSSALQTGKMMQYVPYDGQYVYFRYNDSSTVMVACSSQDTTSQLSLDRFAERTTGFQHCKNVLTGEVMTLPKTLMLKPRETVVWELVK
jgi:neopullulanase